MAKKRKQLFRVKRYRKEEAIIKWRNSPDYKPVSFWESLAASERLQEKFNELGKMIIKVETEKLYKAINI